MFPSEFKLKKDFANPKSMFHVVVNNAEQTTEAKDDVVASPKSKEETLDNIREGGEEGIDNKEKKKKDEETKESPVEIVAKHPLENTWTLWYLENDRSKSWEDMQNVITSFGAAEDFWSLFHYLKPPSEIKIGSDYSMFKKGIRPMWEDPANKQGGRWMITLNKSNKVDLDELWQDVLLCLIGELFDHPDQVCGAVVNIRSKSNKISVWTSDANNKEATLEIGYKLRNTLGLGRQILQYQVHKDVMTKPSNVKSLYIL